MTLKMAKNSSWIIIRILNFLLSSKLELNNKEGSNFETVIWKLD